MNYISWLIIWDVFLRRHKFVFLIWNSIEANSNNENDDRNRKNYTVSIHLDKYCKISLGGHSEQNHKHDQARVRIAELRKVYISIDFSLLSSCQLNEE